MDDRGVRVWGLEGEGGWVGGEREVVGRWTG